MSEVWKAVIGFEGTHEVSDQGRVRSLDRIIPCGGRGDITDRTRVLRGRVLRPMTNHQRGGYRYVNLVVDRKQTLRRVCVLVLAAFKGPRASGMEARHDNGIPSDDRLSNLFYGTSKENAADRKRHGTHVQGEASKNAVLTETDVRRIRTGFESAQNLADEFGVHPGHINNIRRGVRWAHV